MCKIWGYYLVVEGGEACGDTVDVAVAVALVVEFAGELVAVAAVLVGPKV